MAQVGEPAMLPFVEDGLDAVNLTLVQRAAEQAGARSREEAGTIDHVFSSGKEPAGKRFGQRPKSHPARCRKDQGAVVNSVCAS
jgi:hypothetical protein